jgi:2-polyprenyl-3-methyl-5-hydroxy-6-metoxy-1,4-benzoquinol methylase
MLPSKVSDLYDADYYAHSCGDIPYEHSEVWLNFFGNVADHIKADLHPETVLDAGCAMGFLVECLRERGVEAWGIDISEYAISQVIPAIKPFCRVVDITLFMRPSKPYDLVTCIEVLEHLTEGEGALAIANLCRCADTILFSSTPYDFTERTHQNVQMPEYWVDKFAINKFRHDRSYNINYLTRWAMLFRRVR